MSQETWSLNSVKAKSAPIVTSDSAALYDIGDGVACLEINTKMKILTLDVFGFIEQIFPIISRDFTALVIGSDDNNFCAGADLKFFLKEINQQNWDSLKSFIKYGQQTMMLLKYAPFPVVSAVSGMALGGGCELLLHSSAVQAHIETNAGLVEVGVGLIPGWGGCKEMLYRSYKKNGLDGIKAAFSNILTKKVSKSAEYARDMFILGDNSAISMNKTRLLNDAKILALKLVTHHSAQETFVIADLPGGEIANMLDETLQTMKLDEHDQLIAGYLIEIFSAGRQDRTISEQELLTLEQNIFIDLLKTPITN
jgi:3-hydroxyacyl-CoA dehydrogenase